MLVYSYICKPLQIQILKNATILTASVHTKSITESLYEESSGTCRRHMDVMVHKYELQKLLFSNSLSEEVIKEITLLVIKLESLATRLQKIMVC